MRFFQDGEGACDVGRGHACALEAGVSVGDGADNVDTWCNDVGFDDPIGGDGAAGAKASDLIIFCLVSCAKPWVGLGFEQLASCLRIKRGGKMVGGLATGFERSVATVMDNRTPCISLLGLVNFSPKVCLSPWIDTVFPS